MQRNIHSVAWSLEDLWLKDLYTLDLYVTFGATFRSFEKNKDVLELDFHGDTCCDMYIQICLEKSSEERYDLDFDIWWDNFESIGTGTEK